MSKNKVETKTGNMYVMIQEKEQGELICGIKDGDTFIPFGDEDFIQLVTVDTDTIDKEGRADGCLYAITICPLVGNIRKNINNDAGAVDVMTLGIESSEKITINIRNMPDEMIQKTKMH